MCDADFLFAQKLQAEFDAEEERQRREQNFSDFQLAKQLQQQNSSQAEVVVLDDLQKGGPSQGNFIFI